MSDNTPPANNRAKATAAKAALAGIEPRPGVPKPDPIFISDHINRHFGGLVAVDVEHLEVQRGSITALIGPNGAGKTTFFNNITGFDSPNSGTWSFDGISLQGKPAYRIARDGMVRTFQLTKVLTKLTVLENMRLGAQQQSGESIFKSLIPALWRSQERAVTQQALTLLEQFNLMHVKDEFAGALSGGQRKLLEMARAMMARPTMLMLDEPMAGVNPALTQSLLEQIKELREEGITVFFVEHDMDMVRDISDWVVVMAQGKVIAEGPPDVVMREQVVIDAYLGEHHDSALTESGESLTDKGSS
jgi:neutral amino acid transport system ATP-binding protein